MVSQKQRRKELARKGRGVTIGLVPTPSPTPSKPSAPSGGGGVVSGPLPEGTTEEQAQAFREGGISVPTIITPEGGRTAFKFAGGGGGVTVASQIQGPVPETTTSAQEEVFRQTGVTEAKPSIGQPLQVTIAPSPQEKAEDIGRGIPTPSQRFDLDFVRSKVIAPFFFAGAQGETPLTSFRNVGSLFTDTSKKTGDIPFQVPQFGTITQDQPTGFKETTGFELAREQALLDPTLLVPPEITAQKVSKEISQEIIKELQPRVSSGELTIEQAEAEFETQFEVKAEERRPQFETDIGRVTKFRSDVAFGETPALDFGTIGELAGIGALSFTPTGQAILGTAFVSEGIPPLFEAVLGEDLKPSQRIKLAGTGLFTIGLGLGVGGISVRAAERAADVSLLKELQSQTGVITGREIAELEGGGALFDIKSIRQFGDEARVETRLIAPVFETAEGEFSITGGRGKTVGQFFSTERGAIVKLKPQDFSFGGRQVVSEQVPSLVGRDISVGLEEFEGAFGEGFVRFKGQDVFKEFKFGGISKDIQSEFGKITEIKAGGLERLRLGGITKLPKRGTLFREVRGIFDIQETGFIRGLTETEETGVRFITPTGRGKRTPLSVTFQELKIKPPVGITTQIERQVFQPSTIVQQPSQVRRSLVGLQTAVGGEGLTQEQIIKSRGVLFQPSKSAFDTDFSKIQTSLSTATISGTRFDIRSMIKQQPVIKQTQPQLQPQLQFQPQEFFGEQALKQPTLKPPSFIPRIPFEPFEPARSSRFFLPRLPRITFPRERPPKFKGRKRKPGRIAPSFTGIIGFQLRGITGKLPKPISPRIGLLPSQIRLFEPPRLRKKTKKKRVKKKKKKKK